MGLRLRLRADVDISPFGPQSRVILTALKRYGMILADNGSAYYISGAPDPGWNDDELHGLGGIKGSMFEVVDTTGFTSYASSRPLRRTSSSQGRSRRIVVVGP